MQEAATPESEAQLLITQADVAAAKKAWTTGGTSAPTAAAQAFAAKDAATKDAMRILDPNSAEADPVKSLQVIPKASTSRVPALSKRSLHEETINPVLCDFVEPMFRTAPRGGSIWPRLALGICMYMSFCGRA